MEGTVKTLIFSARGDHGASTTHTSLTAHNASHPASPSLGHSRTPKRHAISWTSRHNHSASAFDASPQHPLTSDNKERATTLWRAAAPPTRGEPARNSTHTRTLRHRAAYSHPQYADLGRSRNLSPPGERLPALPRCTSPRAAVSMKDKQTEPNYSLAWVIRHAAEGHTMQSAESAHRTATSPLPPHAQPIPFLMSLVRLRPHPPYHTHCVPRKIPN